MAGFGKNKAKQTQTIIKLVRYTILQKRFAALETWLSTDYLGMRCCPQLSTVGESLRLVITVHLLRDLHSGIERKLVLHRCIQNIEFTERKGLS